MKIWIKVWWPVFFFVDHGVVVIVRDWGLDDCSISGTTEGQKIVALSLASKKSVLGHWSWP